MYSSLSDNMENCNSLYEACEPKYVRGLYFRSPSCVIYCRRNWHFFLTIFSDIMVAVPPPPDYSLSYLPFSLMIHRFGSMHESCSRNTYRSLSLMDGEFWLTFFVIALDVLRVRLLFILLIFFWSLCLQFAIGCKRFCSNSFN